MNEDRKAVLAAACLFATSVSFGILVIASFAPPDFPQNKSDPTSLQPSEEKDIQLTNGSQDVQNKQKIPSILSIGKKKIYDDTYYLKCAHQIRLSLAPPIQSNFRVVCILLLKNGSVIVGTNDECAPNIGGAICAERAALLFYRMQFTKQTIQKVYIVTDADAPIPPGTLCREYLYGHPATTPDTVIVMQSRDETFAPWIVKLKEMHPFPSLYSGLSAQQQVSVGQNHERLVEKLLAKFSIPGILFNDQVLRLVTAAHQAALADDRDVLHPIRYGAAMVVRHDDKIGYMQAPQLKALEYGSTQDAVCQLLGLYKAHCRDFRISGNTSRDSTTNTMQPPLQVLAIVQVDQFGIPHVPFAAARSMLVEHGFGNVQVILTVRLDENEEEHVDFHGDGTLSVESVAAKDLCPFLPDFCKERYGC
ncbi:hypothetical protein MPSEU_000356800 [Mayamaea pseudoterrestris]|nr:hypothetical protein MPSEU_000356800 [Mayamaea pseudoterrestris]